MLPVFVNRAYFCHHLQDPLISCKCCHRIEGRSVCGSVCGWQMVSERFRRNLGRLGVGLKILLWKVLTFVYSYTYWKTKTLPNGPVRKKRSKSLIVDLWEEDYRFFFEDSGGRIFRRIWISQVNGRVFLVVCVVDRGMLGKRIIFLSCRAKAEKEYAGIWTLLRTFRGLSCNS